MTSSSKPAAIALASLVALTACGSDPQTEDPPADLAERDPLGLFEVRYHHWDDLRQHTFGETGEEFDPSVAFDQEWLAYASTIDSPEPDIYVKRLDSRTTRRLTTHPAADRFPAVSPDGERVAFASLRNGNWDIFVVGREGPGPLIEVTHSTEDEIAPTWSPDNKKLCYSARDPYGVWNMWVYDRETSRLTNLGPGLFPSWSPHTNAEDQWIAFQKPQGRGGYWYAIWRIRPDGSEPTQVLSRPEWAAIRPAWSDDGRRIAFATVHKSRYTQVLGRFYQADDIWTIGTDGTDLTNLTDHPAADWSPTWGADGRIYFTSERNGHKNVWSVQPRGTVLTTGTP